MALFKRQKSPGEAEGGRDVYNPHQTMRSWNELAESYQKLPHRIGYVYAEICMEQFFRIYNLFGIDTGRKSVAELAKVLAEEVGDDEVLVRSELDSFGLLIKMDAGQELGMRIQRILDRLRKVRVSNGKVQYVYPRRFTCGVAEVLDENDTLDEVREMAEVARRKSIQEKVPYLFFEKRMQDETLKIKHLLDDSAGAMERNEFVPYFLPKYDLNTREIVGADILARWDHPENGIIMPQVFLPMLEQNGTIMELDMYMLEEACKLIKTWTENEAMPVPLSINIAPLNLYKEDFIERIIGITKKYDVPPCLIELELSEEVFFENSFYLIEHGLKLKEEGFRLSIDNFGVTYTSLSSMKDLPVDVVKLDRRYMAQSDIQRAQIVLKHIIQMAQELGIMMVAEGIEKEGQVDMLKNTGCSYGMGFLFAKPMALDEFEAMML